MTSAGYKQFISKLATVSKAALREVSLCARAGTTTFVRTPAEEGVTLSARSSPKERERKGECICEYIHIYMHAVRTHIKKRKHAEQRAKSGFNDKHMQGKRTLLDKAIRPATCLGWLPFLGNIAGELFTKGGRSLTQLLAPRSSKHKPKQAETPPQHPS